MLNKIINDIRFIRKIDLGGFSSVWLAVHELTHKQLAVKVIPKYSNNGSNNIERIKENFSNGEECENNIAQNSENLSAHTDDKNKSNSNCENSELHEIDLKKKNHFLAEINILSKIDHPLILGYFGDFEDEENHYICMEYLPNGSLLDYINTHSAEAGIKEIVARRIFTELLVAIEYLHKQLKIFHRDLKCDNVLIDSNNNIRLIDFGFSVMYQNPSDRFSEKIGSSGYACPEMISNASYTPEKSDVWCLGIILYSMLVGKLPFDGSNDIETAEKIAFEEPEYPNFLSKNSVDLMKKILIKNPYRRIDINSIKKHPFLSQTELAIISRINPSKSNLSSLDQDILLELSINDKIDITKLTQNDLSVKFSQEMLIYRQLKRARDTKLLQEVIEGKIVSFDQKRKKKHCKFNISGDEDQNDDNLIPISDSENSMPTSSSMPFSSYCRMDTKMKSDYYKNANESNPDIRNHDRRHIPLPDKKPSLEQLLPNLSQPINDTFCDHYVEDTIIDDDDEDYEQTPNILKTQFGNSKGGASTPNFLAFKSPSESENENDSESLSYIHRSNSTHSHRRRHGSKSKKSQKSTSKNNGSLSTENFKASFPSASFSVSSLSSLSKDKCETNLPKKELIRIAPRRRSKVGPNDPKTILSFIH